MTGFMAESDSSSKDEVDERARHKKKGKNGNKTGKSGIHSKIGDSVLSNEWYTHVALEDAVVGEKSFNELMFNLLVAGELEIIGSGKISEKEKNTRVEVLKTLAYKVEFISMKDVLALYSGFLGKIEKGKFKWGSKAAMRVFEQQLMYCVTVERNRKRKLEGRGNVRQKVTGGGKDERKKYCLEFNRDTCNLNGPHEGTLNGNVVTKYHTCKRCLIEDGAEHSHSSKDCNMA